MAVLYTMDMNVHPAQDNRSQTHGPARRIVAEETLIHIPRALVIDPSPHSGALFQQALSEMSLLGVIETHAETALQRYARLHPAIVFVDLDLPDLTGWEILDTLKEASPDGKRPILIVMATPGSPATRIMGRLQGIDGRLIKPVTAGHIQQAVHDALTARRRAGGMLPSALLRRVPPLP